MRYIEWTKNRQRYTATRVRVVEVDKGRHYNRMYKVEGYAKHKWWYKSKWMRLDNNYNTTDTSLNWEEDIAKGIAKRWLLYFTNPDEYDVPKANIIYDEVVITRETHPEHFI